MLVLTRKTGEGLIIGEDIRVTILEIKSGAIRIGIEAPPEKKIYRQEVYERICQENREATRWDIYDLDILSATIKEKNQPK